MSFKSNLPKWCLSTDEENICMFLAGMIDGDGSISKPKDRLHIYSGKKFLIEPIVLSSLRLGILPQICKNRTCYNFQLTGNEIIKIGEFLKRVEKP